MRLGKSLVIGAVVAGLLPPTAPAVGAPRQRVNGTVLEPSFGECNAFISSVLDTGLRIRPFGYRFTVRSTTWKRPFALVPGRTIDDLDITFQGPGHSRTRFETRSVKGERGRVPQYATEALVCLYIGAPAAPFTYTAS